MNIKASSAKRKPTRALSSNERLRELVEASGLSQVEALALFNVAMGLRPLSPNSWRAFFVKPESTRWRRFGDAYLAHAEKIFGRIKRR